MGVEMRGPRKLPWVRIDHYDRATDRIVLLRRGEEWGVRAVYPTGDALTVNGQSEKAARAHFALLRPASRALRG